MDFRETIEKKKLLQFRFQKVGLKVFRGLKLKEKDQLG